MSAQTTLLIQNDCKSVPASGTVNLKETEAKNLQDNYIDLKPKVTARDFLFTLHNLQ